MWRRIALVTLVGGIAAGIGAKVLAQGGPGCCGPHGWHANMKDASPEAMKQRTEAMVKWALADVNATDAQQARIAEILSATMTDLRPLREQHMEARKTAIDLLTQPAIDRAALEALRVRELQLAETMSKRITQSIADAAEVLAPEQRVKLAERMQRMRGRWS